MALPFEAPSRMEGTTQSRETGEGDDARRGVEEGLPQALVLAPVTASAEVSTRTT